jgi:hypothetical protein
MYPSGTVPIKEKKSTSTKNQKRGILQQILSFEETGYYGTPAALIEGFCALEYTGAIFIQCTWKTYFSKFFLDDPRIKFL